MLRHSTSITEIWQNNPALHFKFSHGHRVPYGWIRRNHCTAIQYAAQKVSVQSAAPPARRKTLSLQGLAWCAIGMRGNVKPIADASGSYCVRGMDAAFRRNQFQSARPL